MVLIMESNPLYGLDQSDDSESGTELNRIHESSEDVENNCKYRQIHPKIF